MPATFVRTLTVRSREEGAAEVARSLHGVNDAYKAVVRTTQDGARVIDMTASKLARTEDGWNRLTGRLEGNSSAMRAFVRESTLAKQALDAGLTSVERYSQVVHQLRQELQAAGTTKLGFSVDQGGINSLLGVRANLTKSARDSASVFEEEARLMEGLQVKASRLRAELDPLGAAYERMNREIAEHQQLADRQLISQGELAQASGRSRQAFDDVARSLKPVNDNAKLTSTQLLNLSRQGNDVATMFALGASPMQVFASQAGQVVDALQSGPGGISGSLKAAKDSVVGFVASLSRSTLILGGVGAALTAVAAATVYFVGKLKDVRPLDDVIKTQTAAVKELRDAYHLAGDAADDYSRRARGAIAGEASRETASNTKRLATEAGNLRSQFFSGSDNRVYREAAQYAEIRQAFNDLMASAERGPADFIRFREELSKIADANPDKASWWQAFTKGDLARAVLDASKEMGKLQIAIEGVADVQLQLDRVRAAASRTRYEDARSGFQEFIPDRRTDRERVQRAYLEELGRIKQLRGIKGDEREDLEAGALRQRADALKELDRIESDRRAGYELDIRSVTARTAAEKAGIAADRERIAVSGENISQAEKDRRVEEARTLSFKQSAFELSEALRQRKEAGQDQVEQAQFELTVIGRSTAETAKLRFEFDALAEAKRAARDAGTVVDPAEIDRIKEQAAAIGEATAALEKMNFQRDLVFRLQQAGRSDQDQRIADQLRGAGIDFNSAEGQARAQQLRYVESVEKTSEALRDMRDAGKDAFGDLIDAISQGDNAFDALISSFSGFGRKLASAGFDKLFGGLFGTADPTGSSAGIGVVPTIAKTASSVGGRIGSDAVISAPLAALNDNLQKSSKSALAVAMQFDGLNERADSKVLDSFLRASGNWKGLSAADTAWCASFANAAIMQSGGKGTGSNLASSFLGWGSGTNAPKVGDIVVLKPQSRGASGHVGFVAGFGDGTVQVFGGNQSNGANRKSFGLDQVAAYRTGLGVGDMTKAVSDGSVDAMKRAANGAVPGVQTKPQGSVAAGVDLGGSMNRLGAGMQALGAGLGIFSQGVQSQSPIAGALGGIMGGFQAGTTLGPLLGIAAGAGPIGAIAGGIIGAIGGIFGKSKAKKQAKKQKRDQARQAWDQNKTALRELQDHVTETVRGSMSEDFLTIDENVAQFAALAKETKRSEDTATVSRLRKDAEGYKARAKELFRDTFAPVTEDLAKGLGLDSEFSKARDAVKKTAEAYRGFITDTELAFENPGQGRLDIINRAFETAKTQIENAKKATTVQSFDTQGKPTGSTAKPGIGAAEAAARLTDATKKRDDALAEYQRLYGDVLMDREEAIRKATEAARQGLLRIVSGDVVEQTDVEKALDQSRGAAASLTVQLTKLGMTAEEAADAIDKALSDRLARLKKDFEDNLTGQINDLEGKGYLDQFKDLLKERDDLMADAGRIGADASLVTKYFGLAAQDLVDNAEISGDAFDELVAKFPELVGVIKQASGAIDELNKTAAADAVAKAQSALEAAYNRQSSELEATIERLKDFKDELADLRASLKLDDTLSTLSPLQRMMEAQQQFRDLSTKAASGDEDAQGKLANAASEYLNEAKGYYASSEQYVAIFNEVQSSLQKSETAAGRQLSEAQRQLQTLKDQVKYLMSIDDGVQSVAEAIAALRTAQSTAAMASGSTTWTGGKVTSADPKYGWNIPKNIGIDQGLKDLGLNFTGNYGTGQLATYVGNLPTAVRNQAQSVIDYYTKLYPKAPGYASGGIVANGIWNRDSVMAQLAGGEHVTRATMVNPRTLPVLDAINRTGLVPANGNEAARMEGIERRLDRLTAVVAEGLLRNVEATERGNASAREAATEAKRRNAA